MRTSDIAVNVCGFGLIVQQNLRKLTLKSLTPQSSRDRPRSARQYVPPCNAGPQAQPAVHGTKNSLCRLYALQDISCGFVARPPVGLSINLGQIYKLFLKIPKNPTQPLKPPSGPNVLLQVAEENHREEKAM